MAVDLAHVEESNPVARLSRLAVIASMLLAVAVGLRPLIAQPSLFCSLAGVLVGAAALARWRPRVATGAVLSSAYVAYGTVRLIAGHEIATLPYFLAAFVGLALGVSPWTRWQARRRWRLPLIWWGLSVAIGWLFSAARELQYALPLGGIVAPALLQMSLVLWMDRLLAEPRPEAPAAGDDLPLGPWRAPLMGSALATAAAAIYQARVDPVWMSFEPWISYGRSTALMGDANPAAVATGTWAPIAFHALSRSRLGVIAGLLVALPLWLATWFTGARSSLILMAGGVAALTLAAVQPWGWRRRAIAAFAAAVVAAVGWLLVSTAVTNVDPQKAQKTPIGRLVVATQMKSLGEALYEILWSRNGYGLAAVEAIKDHPIVGVGVGRFYTMAPNYHERLKGHRIPPDNAQSLWRHTWAEQGLIGLLPLLWLTGLTALATLSRPIEGKDVVQRVMLASLGVALLVGYPVQDAGIAVTLATLVCAVAGPRRSPST